jgi:CheY-like chemotaxis protein
MTSYAMAGDRERLLSAGCNGYIEKPIDPESVMDQINKILASI